MKDIPKLCHPECRVAFVGWDLRMDGRLVALFRELVVYDHSWRSNIYSMKASTIYSNALLLPASRKVTSNFTEDYARLGTLECLNYFD